MLTLNVTLNRASILSANGREHWRKAAAKKAALRAWGEAVWLKAGRPTLTAADLVVTITWPDRRRRDAANLHPTLKALIDGMVSPRLGDGLLADDSDAYLTGPDLRVSPDVSDDGLTHLTFTYIERTPR